MIDELDEGLRRLLIRELPIRDGEVEISFHQPSREWSGRLGRPTLNLFLYDVRENTKLRFDQFYKEMERKEGKVTQVRKPLRYDLYYMLTAWAKDPEDEHRILGRAVVALSRSAYLPEEFVPESAKSASPPLPPVSIQVAQHEVLERPSDIWNVMDNLMRPAVPCVITMAINPFAPFAVPMPRSVEFRMGDVDMTDIADQTDKFFAVRGKLHSRAPLQQVRLRVVEKAQEVPLEASGDFAIHNLRAGNYTLEVLAEGRAPSRHALTVPSPSYDVEL
jgi:hypothetical protein